MKDYEHTEIPDLTKYAHKPYQDPRPTGQEARRLRRAIERKQKQKHKHKRK